MNLFSNSEDLNTSFAGGSSKVQKVYHVGCSVTATVYFFLLIWPEKMTNAGICGEFDESLCLDGATFNSSAKEEKKSVYYSLM